MPIWSRNCFSLCSQALRRLPDKQQGAITKARLHTSSLCPFPPRTQSYSPRVAPSDPTRASPRQPEQRLYPVLAVSQGQVPTGILPGCGDDCYPPCLQTRVSCYESEVQTGEHRSAAAQGVSGHQLVKVLLLGPALSCPHPGKSQGPSDTLAGPGLWVPLPFQGLG